MSTNRRKFIKTGIASVAGVSLEGNIEMPPVPPGEPANTELIGGESTVWAIESARTIPVQTILDSLRAGKGQWGKPPA